MPHYVKTYSVFDGEKEVFNGTAAQIGEKYYLNKDVVYKYIRDHNKYNGMYWFVESGKILVYDSKKYKKRYTKPKAKPTKHETELEWIKTALNLPPYYMTSYHNKGQEFVEELKEMGIEFITEKCPYKRGHYYLIRT